MPQSNKSARASWPILAAVIVVTAGVWGLYAWKYASPAGTPSPTAEAGPPEDHLTALRATRPIAANDSLEPRAAGELTTSVNANAPRTLDAEGVEMTLLKKNAKISASPAPAQAAANSSHQLAPPTASALAAQVKNGRAYLAKGDLLAARAAFSAAIDRGLSWPEESDLRTELERISNALLFSRATNTNDPLTSVRTIAAGDSIHAIARQNRITDELIMSINGVTEPNKIAVGRRLKVIQGPFRAVISKSRHRMDVYLGEVFVRSFRVGLGTNGGTPTGSWIVRNKLDNPDWTDPRNGRHYLADDPDNPIGERWIGLEGIAGEAVGKQGFGIHGTIDPKSIGENLSMGCVRLTPDDIQMVYELLVERYSGVEIRS